MTWRLLLFECDITTLFISFFVVVSSYIWQRLFEKQILTTIETCIVAMSCFLFRRPRFFIIVTMCRQPVSTHFIISKFSRDYFFSFFNSFHCSVAGQRFDLLFLYWSPPSREAFPNYFWSKVQCSTRETRSQTISNFNKRDRGPAFQNLTALRSSRPRRK